MKLRITHCLCFEASFASLKKVAAANHCHSVEELQQHAEFGKRCRLCHPYVKKMLQTGETEFHELLFEEPPE